MQKKYLLVISSFLLGAMVLSGCGSNEEKTPDKSSESVDVVSNNDSSTVKNSEKEKSKENAPTSNVSVKLAPALPADINMESLEKQLNPQALQLIKLYASALETGNTVAYHNLVDKYITNEEAQQYNKDDFDDRVETNRDITDESELKKLIDALQKANASGLELAQSRQDGPLAVVSYTYLPEGFSSSDEIYVDFEYIKAADGNYLLETISVN